MSLYYHKNLYHHSSLSTLENGRYCQLSVKRGQERSIYMYHARMLGTYHPLNLGTSTFVDEYISESINLFGYSSQ